MNRIMELALSLGNKMKNWPSGDTTLGEVEDARRTLQSEVTRVEAELAALVAENENISNLWSLMKKERDELQAKVAEQNDMLKMLAQRARSFPHYPIGFHIPEVFAAVGETPPSPGAKP